MSDGDDDPFHAETDRPLLALLREHGRSHVALALVGVGLRLAWMLPGQAGPALVGYLFDTVFSETRAFAIPLVPAAWLPETQLGQLWFAVGVLLGLSVVGHAVGLVRSLAWGRFAYRLQHDIRTDTYDVVQRLEMGFFDDNQTGEVMSVLNNDVDAMETFFTDTIDSAMTVASFVVGVSFYMFLLNWQFALVALSVAPVIVVVNYRFSDIIGRVYERVRETEGKLNAQLRNSVSGVSVVKAYTAEPFEHERVADASDDVVDANVEAIDVGSIHYPSMRLLTGAGVFVTFSLGSFWVMNGPPGPFTAPLTAGALVTFLLYTQHIAWPMREVAGIIESYQNARASADRLVGVRNASESVTERPDAEDLTDVDGRVEYRDVSFSYSEESDGDPVITDISFTANAGETVGIVGPTGAGKSTLLKLLLRFYDVDEGTVRVDGTDVRDVSLDSLRDSIGYISQDPYLFSGTVRENVTYGTTVDDDEAVWDAVERAEADAFVSELPDGLDTRIGERGVKLSGGQRQRLCLARAMLLDPAILVLDEATSHVDNETEVLIQQSLRELTRERTTFVVAHRLSTVKDADRILVLDDGNLVEEGSHEELLANGDGLYASLWSVQVGDVDSHSGTYFDEEPRSDTPRSE
ncbi:ABC transporter ATP-binding protein [Halosimplex marinum]|uniref:ABC transporter ATP-binding protein n=1 Tax=Halosimplex marinum TaxID=3396620 RepID=UPI003F557013